MAGGNAAAADDLGNSNGDGPVLRDRAAGGVGSRAKATRTRERLRAKGVAEEEIARITNTTYDATSIPMNLPGNYVSLRFTSEGDGYAKIAAACIRYDGAAGEDAQ